MQSLMVILLKIQWFTVMTSRLNYKTIKFMYSFIIKIYIKKSVKKY